MIMTQLMLIVLAYCAVRTSTETKVYYLQMLGTKELKKIHPTLVGTKKPSSVFLNNFTLTQDHRRV